MPKIETRTIADAETIWKTEKKTLGFRMVNYAETIGFRMVSAWFPQMVSAWFPELRKPFAETGTNQVSATAETIRKPCGYLAETIRKPIVSAWFPHSFRVAETHLFMQ